MFNSLRYPPLRETPWPLDALTVSEDTSDTLRSAVKVATDASPWGWGHTIDFGSFKAEGFLGTDYLAMIGAIDRLGWWPRSLEGLNVADVGCFSGGVSAILAARRAESVIAIDEIPEHVEQLRIVKNAFLLDSITAETASVYELDEITGPETLDGVFVGGVLYHLSDMLAGLVIMRRSLKPGGWIIVESNVDECETRSFANFGRFYAGMWWQPSVLAVRDLLAFAGFSDIETQVYRRNRVIARGIATGEEIPYRRGFPIAFDDVHDIELRTLDAGVMAPATCWRARLRSTVRTVMSKVSKP